MCGMEREKANQFWGPEHVGDVEHYLLFKSKDTKEESSVGWLHALQVRGNLTWIYKYTYSYRYTYMYINIPIYI